MFLAPEGWLQRRGRAGSQPLLGNSGGYRVDSGSPEMRRGFDEAEGAHGLERPPVRLIHSKHPNNRQSLGYSFLLSNNLALTGF